MEIFRDEPLSPTARATVRTWNRELACPMFQCAEHVCMAFGFCLLLQFVESQNPGSLTHVFKLKGQPWASLSFVTYSPVQESCTVSADPGLSLLLSVSHTAKSSLARQGRGPPAKQLRRPSDHPYRQLRGTSARQLRGPSTTKKRIPAEPRFV